MENLDTPQEGSSFISNTEINSYLLETSKWGKFLAIVGFVGMGLIVLLVIFITFGSSEMSKIYGEGFPMKAVGFFYMLIAGLYFFPINYLYQYSVKIKRGVQSNDSLTITYAFENLKSLFKFMGIFTIVILSMYGLILLIALPMVFFFSH
jgi:hypothetical protein